MTGKAIERLTAPNPTRADFLDALLSIKDEDLDGQIPPVDYTVQSTGHFLQDCWTLHTVENGRLVHIDEDGEPVDPADVHLRQQGLAIDRRPSGTQRRAPEGRREPSLLV